MKFIKLNKITADRYSDSDEDVEQMRTTPASVNVAAIRCFYPRRNDRPGTRITFTDGGGWACSESFDEVLALLAA